MKLQLTRAGADHMSDLMALEEALREITQKMNEIYRTPSGEVPKLIDAICAIGNDALQYCERALLSWETEL